MKLTLNYKITFSWTTTFKIVLNFLKVLFQFKKYLTMRKLLSFWYSICIKLNFRCKLLIKLIETFTNFSDFWSKFLLFFSNFLKFQVFQVFLQRFLNYKFFQDSMVLRNPEVRQKTFICKYIFEFFKKLIRGWS